MAMQRETLFATERSLCHGGTRERSNDGLVEGEIEGAVRKQGWTTIE
jgi:hypothetical protein